MIKIIFNHKVISIMKCHLASFLIFVESSKLKLVKSFYKKNKKIGNIVLAIFGNKKVLMKKLKKVLQVLNKIMF